MDSVESDDPESAAIEISTPLTIPERTIAWWTTTHLTRGTYYTPGDTHFKGPRMSTTNSTTNPQALTIVSFETIPSPDPADQPKAETHVTLSDGTVFRSAGIVASSEFGGCYRLAMTPLDDGTKDVTGPIIDAHAKALLAALGTNVSAIEVPPTPIAVAAEQAAPATSTITPETQAADSKVETAAHEMVSHPESLIARIKTLGLDAIRALGRDAHEGLAELETLFHRL